MAGLARVTHVAMEATGIYSMPVYYALVEHGDFIRVLICNAAHVKNVPGRKTDYADAEWLAHLLECGLLAGGFIPPADVKAARDVIKIDSVASSIATKSGRAMIEALIDGERCGPALRPSEAVMLREADLYLPKKGWGRIVLAASASRAATAWTDDGTARGFSA